MKKMDDDEEITVALQATGSLIKMDTCKVILNRNYNRCKLPSSLSFNEADIDKIWIERSTQNSKLYNGTKFRLHSMSMQRKQLHLQIGITCYKDFLGTNWSPESARILEMGKRDFGNSQAYMADAIGVGTLLVTNDQMVVIIKRSQHCGEAPGLWDIPGGHPEPQELVGKIGMDEIDVDTLDASDVVQEIFSSILREIQDEINIPQTVLSKPELMGIARNNTSAGRPSLEFLVRCKLGSKEIIDLYNKGSQCEADESTQIRLLTLSEVFQLTDNNNDFWNCLAPSAKDYGDFKRAEAEYKLQRQILKDYTDKWRHKTLKYLNFNAKEQKVGVGSQIASLFLSPKYTQDSNYAKFLQKVQAENRIGLNKRNSFNRDKYGKKTQSHNYELMGDILRRPVQSAPGPVMSGGWTFKESHKAGSCFGMNGQVIDYNQRRYCKWKERQKTQTSSPLLPDESYGGLKLSTNIKHKYGSSVCNDVLGDEMAVLQTVADLERKDRREKKLTPSLLQPNSYRSASLKSSCKKLSYYDLSNILRNNIFPGDGVTYNCGLTHSDYNDDICNEPTKVSQYRRRKIKLGF